MSRVAKQPITIPEGVKVELNENLVSVSGKNGSMEFELVKDVTVDTVSYTHLRAHETR